jgi:hypothetical protein
MARLYGREEGTVEVLPYPAALAIKIRHGPDARPDAQSSGSDARIRDIAVFGRRGVASAMF